MLGVVIQVVVIRPVQHSVIAVVIITVGLFILIDGLVMWKWGADLKFMPAPFGNASTTRAASRSPARTSARSS